MTPGTLRPNVACARRQISAGLLVAVMIAGGWLRQGDDPERARFPRTPLLLPAPIAAIPPPTGAARKTLGLRIDLNRASARDLQILPGIGPGLARRIVAFRREHGPFASPEELLHVKGIGKKRLLRLQPLITAVPLPHSPGRKVPHLRNRDIVTPLSERKNQNSM